MLCLQDIPDGAAVKHYNQPVSDFEEKGNGLCEGTCEIIVELHNLCVAGEALCSDFGMFTLEFGAGAACAAVGLLVTAGLGAVGAGILCAFAFHEGLQAFCHAEGLDGNLKKCAAAAVRPVVSMQYFAISSTDHCEGPFTTATMLGTFANQLGTTISPTATALVPSCVAKGNAYPAAGSADCPYEQLAETYKRCTECYESGLPWEADIMFDIVSHA